MSIVVFNVLTVPEPMRETLEGRFSARAGAVENSDGFEWFELLRPVEGTDRYLVYTRWRDKAAFEAWTSSQDFTRGHGGPATSTPSDAASSPSGAPAADAPRPPAATGSEIWTFDVVTSAGAKSL